MKIAFVVGFYDPVKTALNARFPETSYQDRLIWIASGKRTLIAFKERFYDVVQTTESLLVCLGRAGAQRYLEDDMRGIIRVAEAQYTTPIEFKAFGNLYDPQPVIELVNSFGLEAQPQITVEDIRKRISVGKILCVSLAGKTSILAALERAGFCPAAIDECFEEEVIEGARNSNLNAHLKSQAKSYPYLIYAWEGARTSTREVKNAFAIDCIEAHNAAQVVELFKKWIMEGV